MEQTSESDMAGTLELGDQKCKATMMNMLRALLDKVVNMKEQMTNVN